MQVFDLSNVKPNEFVQYGLGCLEKLAELGDYCAKDTRQKLRIVVCTLFHVSSILSLCFSLNFIASTCMQMIIMGI